MCSYVRDETRVYVLICTLRNACLCAHMYAKKHMFMFSYGLDSRGALDEYLKMFTGQYTRFRCQLLIEQRRSGESNLLVSSLLAYTKYAQTKKIGSSYAGYINKTFIRHSHNTGA